MATAKKVPKEEFDVQLILSKEEAATLKCLLGSGIRGVGTIREYLDSIFYTLEHLNISDKTEFTKGQSIDVSDLSLGY